MKIFSFLFGLGLLMAFASCQENDDNNCTQLDPIAKCICTADVEPVCGCNNQTYNNACRAECDGIYDYVDGACN